MQSIQLTTLDVEGFRTQLRKMTDEELREFGKAARYMVSPKSKHGKATATGFRAAIRGSSRRMAQETSGGISQELKQF